MSTAIGLLEIDLLIPGSGSLKNKRSVLNTIRDKTKSKFNISIAEVGHLDKQQRSHLGIVTICNQRLEAEKRLMAVLELVEQITGVEVIKHTIQWL